MNWENVKQTHSMSSMSKNDVIARMVKILRTADLETVERAYNIVLTLANRSAKKEQ